MRQSGYILLFVLAACVFVLHYSTRIIEEVLLKSADIIARVAELLKSKEEKEFNRLLLRGYPQILTFLIAYFHQFMWIHKLRRFKGKYKYKKLLLEGLEIF
jgi:ABC-type arginine transport system permease subunit